MTEARRADLAYVATAAFALGALAAFGALQRRLELIGNDDLSRIWAGPRALLTGADPYDPATWAATAHALGTLPPDTPVYIYPPWVALVLVPLALLPLNVASLTWLVASVVAGITGLRFLLRVALPGRPLMHAVAAAMLLLSWVGALSPSDYQEFVAPYSARILAAVEVPSIHFGTGTATLLPSMADAGGDVIGLDWRIPLDRAWAEVGDDRGVQGNLDPAVLLAPWERIESETRAILARAGGRPGHVFNLGHGVPPNADPAVLGRLTEFVHEATVEARV